MTTRLTPHTFGVLQTLWERGPIEALNFQRVALASLASDGLVDVIDGVASITERGKDTLSEWARRSHTTQLSRRYAARGWSD